MNLLPEIELMKIHSINEEKDSASFVIEPLLPGYGMTLGNALRRVLFSSLSGSALTSVKIEGVDHEFSTISGVKEDVVDIILNLKSLRVKSFSDEQVTLKLSKKGPGPVKAKDFAKNSQVEIVDPNFIIATLDKNGKISMEVTVEKGRGYVPTEQRKEEKLPIGTIALDSIFSPIKKVRYQVDNTRVGGMTNYDKLTIDITTDGSISPRESLEKATNIILEHFTIIAGSLKAKDIISKKVSKVEKTIKAKNTSKTKKVGIKENKKTIKAKKA